MAFFGLLIYLVPLLFSIIAHEYMHGKIAERFGDHTARLMGRLTFNPLKHIDPVGSIVVPFILYMSSRLFLGTPIVIGWAKPVPVNYLNLRNPRKDMIWISLAGPLTNLSIAFASGLLIRLLIILPMASDAFVRPLFLLLICCVIVNIALALFNLLPIPPLDGSKVLAGVLPPQWSSKYLQYERYGFFIILGVIVLGNIIGIDFLQLVMAPPMNVLARLFTGFSIMQLFHFIV